MNYGDHNFIEITQQTKLRVELDFVERVDRVELCCSTMSTQPKCMGSTRRTCRVQSSSVESRIVEFGLMFVFHTPAAHERLIILI